MAALLEANAPLLLSSGAALVSKDVALGIKPPPPPAEETGERTKLLTWGCGACGQLGHGAFSDSPTPTHVAMLASGKEVPFAPLSQGNAATFFRVF